MSIKRLNADERVTYAVGKAIVESLTTSTRDPDRARSIVAAHHLLEATMSPDDFAALRSMTGVISEDLSEELMALPYDPNTAPENDGPSDEIPF
jgi:hypothetical protein